MSAPPASSPQRGLKIVPILAGGGTRLSAHIGAITALQRLNVGFDHIVGVSGGSIVAALYAAGKSMDEINQLALNVDFRQFRGFSLYQLLFFGGLSSGDKFENWLTQQIGKIRFIDVDIGLNIVATDVQSGQPVIFNKLLTPETEIADAVRCSMGIPLVFTFKLQQGKILVDGSILSEGVLRQDWSGKGVPVCFFRIRSRGYYGVESHRPPSLPRYVAMLIRTFMTTMSREYIHDAYWHSTIVIDSESISPLEFALSPESKAKLYQQGFETTMKYLPEKFLRYHQMQFEGDSSRVIPA